MSQRYIGGLIYNPPGGYSGYFDGSGDYLSVADATALNVSTGDFTLECWAFPTSSSTYQVVFAKGGVANTDVQGISLSISGGTFVGLCRGSGAQAAITSSAFALSTWNHLVLVRSGTTLALFVNGVRAGTQTNSNDASNTRIVSIGTAYDASLPFTGYISNARLVKGTAVYDPTQTSITVPNGPLQNITNTSLLTCRYPTFVDGSSNAFTITVNGNTTVSTQNPFPLTTLPNPAQGGAGNGIFSMSQYQSLKQQNLWPAIDPYFDYTTLLLHGNGTNGGQNNTFQDSSSNNFTITRNGNTTQGTFSPFSQTGWSNYFDGSSDGLTTSTSTDFDGFGNGTSWQIDFWWFPITGPTQWDGPFETVGGAGIFFRCRSGYLDFTNNNDNAGLIRSNYPSLNTWHHVVLVCDGSTNQRSVFIDGTRTGTITNTSQFNNGSFGLGTLGTGVFNGYLSNFRVIKGSRTYDPSASTITVPTSPSTAVSGTVLLTCQSNRFVDTNTQTTPKTFTVSGNTSVQAFSPFAPTAAYSASTVGGSGYFDGTGDSLSVPDNAAFDFGTGEFTTECWVYFNNISGDQYVLSYDGGTTPDHIGINIYNGAWRIGGFNSYLITGSTGLIAQQWIHVVMTRQSNTLRAYINGVQLGTSDVTGISFNANNTLYIGGEFSSGGVSFNLNGYISGMRIVKDGNLYPNGTTFTPPTTPPTTTVSSGTVSLLCNFTNAAIIDNTAKNVLETVADAQISTTQSKFGGASIYLDGNDNCVIPNSENFNFRNGDFTIEFWYYPSTLTVVNAHILDFGDGLTGGQNGWNVGFFGASNTNTLGVIWTYDGSSENKIQDSVALTTGSWVFVTVVRSGTSLVLYKNGISVASATLSGAIATSNRPLVIGSNQSLTSGYVNGYIDDLRITKGIARYTSNFTPQTSQWQDQ